MQLTKNEQNIYRHSFKNSGRVREMTFVSTSKIKALAMLYFGNTLFIIKSKTGKEIEKIAKSGYGSIYNENEVLFEPNREFEILEIDENAKNLLIITMEEV